MNSGCSADGALYFCSMSELEIFKVKRELSISTSRSFWCSGILWLVLWRDFVMTLISESKITYLQSLHFEHADSSRETLYFHLYFHLLYLVSYAKCTWNVTSIQLLVLLAEHVSGNWGFFASELQSATLRFLPSWSHVHTQSLQWHFPVFRTFPSIWDEAWGYYSKHETSPCLLISAA